MGEVAGTGQVHGHAGGLSGGDDFLDGNILIKFFTHQRFNLVTGDGGVREFIAGQEEIDALTRVIKNKALFRYGVGNECDRFEARYAKKATDTPNQGSK